MKKRKEGQRKALITDLKAVNDLEHGFISRCVGQIDPDEHVEVHLAEIRHETEKLFEISNRIDYRLDNVEGLNPISILHLPLVDYFRYATDGLDFALDMGE